MLLNRRRQSIVDIDMHRLKPACSVTSSSGGGLNRLINRISSPNGEVVAQATGGVSTCKVEKTTFSPFFTRLSSWVNYTKTTSSPNGEGRVGCQPALNTNRLDFQPFRLRMTERTHYHCEPRSGVAIQCPKYLDCFVCLSLLTPHPSPLPKEREKPVINLMPLSQCKTWRTPPC